MNRNNKFVNNLKNLGFSERQAKVYSALLEKMNASLSDLQKISGNNLWMLRRGKLSKIK